MFGDTFHLIKVVTTSHFTAYDNEQIFPQEATDGVFGSKDINYWYCLIIWTTLNNTLVSKGDKLTCFGDVTLYVNDDRGEKGKEEKKRQINIQDTYDR